MTTPDPLRAAHDAHGMDRLTRGRPLTDAEVACYIADHQTALRHGTARVGDEIAEMLRDRAALATDTAPLDAAFDTAVLAGRLDEFDAGTVRRLRAALEAKGPRP